MPSERKQIFQEVLGFVAALDAIGRKPTRLEFRRLLNQFFAGSAGEGIDEDDELAFSYAIEAFLGDGEEQPNDKEKPPKEAASLALALKKADGRSMNVRQALVNWRWLQMLQDTAPDHFDALCKLAEGRRAEVIAASIDYLKARNYLDKATAEITEEYRLVLAASLRESRDGKVLVNPLVIATDEELKAIEGIDKDIDRALSNLFLGRNDPGKQGPGR